MAKSQVTKCSARLSNGQAKVFIEVCLDDIDVELASLTGGYSLVPHIRLAIMQALVVSYLDDEQLLDAQFDEVADDVFKRKAS